MTVVPSEQTRVLVVRDAFDSPGSDHGVYQSVAPLVPQQNSKEPRFRSGERASKADESAGGDCANPVAVAARHGWGGPSEQTRVDAFDNPGSNREATHRALSMQFSDLRPTPQSGSRKGTRPRGARAHGLWNHTSRLGFLLRTMRSNPEERS